MISHIFFGFFQFLKGGGRRISSLIDSAGHSLACVFSHPVASLELDVGFEFGCAIATYFTKAPIPLIVFQIFPIFLLFS